MTRAATESSLPEAPEPDTPVEPAREGSAPGVADCLHLDPDTRRDASLRLKSARGHLDGIVRMLEDPEVYCVDVLKQIKAVQGALTRANGTVLRAHVRDHVATASTRGDTDAIVDELMEALKYRA
ncbi:MAG: metal-sensitive transcriptional regulator [Trueperaceae bacterium]|nr:metal-sensitive transcriptional regulator [Trueperaceae bacterium]